MDPVAISKAVLFAGLVGTGAWFDAKVDAPLTDEQTKQLVELIQQQEQDIRELGDALEEAAKVIQRLKNSTNCV